MEDDVKAAVECFADHFDVFDAPVTVLAFLRTYPQSFVVAVLLNDDKVTEEIIGVCASPIGPQDTAFFGLYGLKEKYRSFGIGSRLFKHCLDYIGPSRSVGLYAVPEMREKYMTRGGFTTAEGIFMVNYVGEVPSEHLNKMKDLTENPDSLVVKTLNAQNMDESFFALIVQFDSTIHYESREKLLRNALTQTAYRTVAVFADGKMKGTVI